MYVFAVFPAGMSNRARLIADTPWYLLSGLMNTEIIIMLVNAVFIISGFHIFLWVDKECLNSYQDHFSVKLLLPQTFSLLGNDCWPSVHSCLQERFHSVWEPHQSLIYKVTWRVLPTATVRVCMSTCVCVCLCKWKARSWRQQIISVWSLGAAITDTQTWWTWQFWWLVWGCVMNTEQDTDRNLTCELHHTPEPLLSVQKLCCG